MRSTPLIATLLLAATITTFAADDYKPGPDSLPQDRVPHGDVTVHTFDQSKIFPGTTREYRVYVPKQYDPAKPTPVLIMQDGIRFRAIEVLDNLINKKDIPPMIGIFVAPGVVLPPSTNTALPRFNRSFEYDGLGDDYARFLLDELLPHIIDDQKLNLSSNANDRMLAGESSGAIASFTAAWHRPDAFRRVFSAIGTYVDLRGGNAYPPLIRQTEPKPIRVFLQDGTNDLNIYGGNWFLANQEMLSAFEFSGYNVNHAWGDGSHNGIHSTSIFPDAMRWLWRDYPTPIIANIDNKTNQPLSKILMHGEEWQLVGDHFSRADGITANAAGEVFFSDRASNCIYKVALDGRLSIFKEQANAGGLFFGPDGKLYAGQGSKKRVVSFDADGKEDVLAEDIQPNDIVVGNNGNVYVTDSPNKRVWLLQGHEKRVVNEGIASPNGIRFSADQSLLYVADYRGQFVYSFSVQSDGSLTNSQRFYRMHLMDGSTQSSADGMTVDSFGWLYVTTDMGIQACDDQGRANGIIVKPDPQSKGPNCVAFGGKDFDTLFVACGDKVFKRRTQARGVLSSQPPIKPTKSRL